MRHYFIYILALTACLTIAGCSDDDELRPSYADQNRFFATDSATNPVSAMRNEFYRETGSYLLFNDTLRHEAIGTDAEGNTITLSGKEAVFSVTLNAITQSVVPTLTDEWVETNFAASDDLHTADALRQYFDSALYANNLDNAVMDYLLNNATFKEIPTQITSYYIRMFLNYHSQLATQYGMELDAYAQAKGYADANAMLADSDAYFEHLAKQDLVFQAIAEQLDITPTQEQIDSANSSYTDTYGAQRSMLNALQLAVLDKVEESAVLS